MSLRSYERENGLRLQITPMVVSHDLPAACCACPYAISARLSASRRSQRGEIRASFRTWALQPIAYTGVCFLLYTTPPRFAEALVHSGFHQAWDMGRDDDVYVSPMISKQAHGEALRFDRCGITSHPRSSEQNVDARGV